MHGGCGKEAALPPPENSDLLNLPAFSLQTLPSIGSAKEKTAVYAFVRLVLANCQAAEQLLHLSRPDQLTPSPRPSFLQHKGLRAGAPNFASCLNRCKKKNVKIIRQSFLTLNYLPKSKIRGSALDRRSGEGGKGVKITTAGEAVGDRAAFI